MKSFKDYLFFETLSKKCQSAGRITQKDFLLGNRRASREEEISFHGHPISYSRTFKSKKDYTRKQKHKKDYE